jgi:hypothetical protein
MPESAIKTPTAAQPACVVALAISGMNDVLNSQRDTRSPRGGVILVQPQNLVSLAQSLQAHELKLLRNRL